MHAANQACVAGQDDGGTGGGQLAGTRFEISAPRFDLKARRGRLTAGVRPNWRLQANALVDPRTSASQTG